MPNKECPDCGKTFSTNQQLKRHLNRKYPCTYKECPHCATSFTKKASYDYHVEHEVCLRNPDRLLKKIASSVDESEVAKDKDKEDLKLEIEKLKLIIRGMELQQQARPSTAIHINADKVIISLLSIGNENLEPLDFNTLNLITQKQREGFTDYGIKILYFNANYPENQVFKPKDNPRARTMEYFNGVTHLNY